MSVAAFIWALALSPAGAITILSSQSAGSIPGASGTGLSGSFYSFAAFTSSISSLAQADSLIAAHPTPTATFTATTPCVQTCGASVNDSLTVLQFLSSTGTNIAGTTSGTLGLSATVFSGYIAISSASTHSFAIFSDDGSTLKIGGTTILTADGIHGLSGGSTSVTFQSAGLYAFYGEYFENAGGTGFTVQMDGTNISTSLLYAASAPEPATMGVLAVGLLGLRAARRRGLTAA